MSLVRLSLASRSSGSLRRSSTATAAARSLVAGGYQRRWLTASVPRASLSAAPVAAAGSSSAAPENASNGDSPHSATANPLLKPMKAFYSPPPAVEAPPQQSKPRAARTSKGPQNMFELVPQAPAASRLPRAPARNRSSRNSKLSYSGRTVEVALTEPNPFQADEEETSARLAQLQARSVPLPPDVPPSTPIPGPSRTGESNFRLGSSRRESYDQPASGDPESGRVDWPPRDDRPSRRFDDRPSRQFDRSPSRFDRSSRDSDARPGWQSSGTSARRPANWLHDKVAELTPAVDDALDGIRRSKRHPKKPEYEIDERFEVPGHAPPPSRGLAYRSPLRPEEENYHDRPAFKKPTRPTPADEAVWGGAAQVKDRLEASRLRMNELKRAADERAAADSEKKAASKKKQGSADPVPIDFDFDTASFEAASPRELPSRPAKPVEPLFEQDESEEDSFFSKEGVDVDEAKLRRREERRASKARDPQRTGHILPAAGGKKAVARFLGLGIREDIAASLCANFPHIEEPTKFQRQLLSKVALGHDVIAQQATGRGKTFSILLALLSLEKRRAHVKGSKVLQATALMVVPSMSLARQVMDWAALMVPPEQLERSIQIFDPTSPSTFALGPAPPTIVVTTTDALRREFVAPMRALCLQTIALDEADVLLAPQTRRMEAMSTIEKMLTTGFQNSPVKNNPERRKPQIIAVGSTVSPAVMRYLKGSRQWVSPKVQVIVQGSETSENEDKALLRAPSRLVPDGELPDLTSYNTPELARIVHHVVVVAPSGRSRNLTAPAPLERDLEPLPTPDLDAEGQPPTRVPSHILNAFKTLYQASTGGDASKSGRALLVLRDQAAVQDARSRLAEAGISSQTLPTLSSTEDATSPSESEETSPASTLLITDTASCRGLDFADLTTVYTTAGAIAGVADYIHIAGRLARLGSVTGGDGTSGKVVTLVQGDTQEPPAEKAARLEEMASWIKKRRAARKAKVSSSSILTPTNDEAAQAAKRFPPVLSWEVEKIKVALSTLDAKPTDLPLTS